MNRRLKEIQSIIKDGKGVIDVGTDHGYLPIALSLSGYKGNIFASDINIGPLQTAINNANEEGIDNISFLLCDGLDKCRYDLIDTIVIAGMGGDTICDIIDKAEWTMDSSYSLILQPMTKSEILRYYLSNNGYSIEYEKIVRDSGKIYSILSVRFTGSNELYTDGELFVGKSYDESLFNQLLDGAIDSCKRRDLGLEKSNSPDYISSFYGNITDELIRMRKQNDKG